MSSQFQFLFRNIQSQVDRQSLFQIVQNYYTTDYYYKHYAILDHSRRFFFDGNGEDDDPDAYWKTPEQRAQETTVRYHYKVKE
jgi:hypothetical protein